MKKRPMEKCDGRGKSTSQILGKQKQKHDDGG